MWYFFDAGGPLMYLLLACSVLTLAYTIERSIHFFRAGRSADVPEAVHDLIEKEQIDGALRLSQASSGPVAAVLTAGLLHAGEKKESIEEEVTLTGNKEIKRLSKNLHLIELISRIAPLIGLLGTVLGMVNAFQQVAYANSSVDPSMLAGGIWEALLTTAAGLGVAIPSMVVHHLLEEKVQSFTFLMQYYGSEAIKHLGK
ncbi:MULTISPECIES: MotA/TolQ/ExbB proton channel family protein [Prosthecochloris]|nr:MULTISPECIES: MotA/TolQ/ExbB proton channel family protein [Prosthecochloris]UZJ39911.1 MotA/TolQ/ExbB proton channel family protein [Prosthecochloris sp. SCSIO W1102]